VWTSVYDGDVLIIRGELPVKNGGDWAEGVTQVLGHLPSKQQAVSSNPRAIKTKPNKNGGDK
jgi:hypothetical protein